MFGLFTRVGARRAIRDEMTFNLETVEALQNGGLTVGKETLTILEAFAENKGIHITYRSEAEGEIVSQRDLATHALSAISQIQEEVALRIEALTQEINKVRDKGEQKAQMKIQLASSAMERAKQLAALIS